MSSTMHTTNGHNGATPAPFVQGNGHDAGAWPQWPLLPALTHGKRASLAALDHFRTLALTVDRLAREGSARSIVLLSAAANEGRSLSAELLAVALGELRPPVRMLDADPFQHPVEPDRRRGWRGWRAPSAGRADGESAAAAFELAKDRGDIPAYARIPVGRQSHASHSTFLRELRAVLEAEAASAKTVIVDVPACNMSSIGFAVAEMVDAAIYVVRPGRASVDTHRDVLAQLALLDVNVLGILLNEG